MATVTLTGNTNYSALTLANDDDIDLAGFILTLDIQPTHTGIQVISPGTAGTVIFDGAWVLPTWDFYAGSSTTAGMIGTLPEGAEIRNAIGGGITNARCISLNYGTVAYCQGGDGNNSFGITTNYGAVGSSVGGGANFASGISSNLESGRVGSAIGSSITNGPGISTNRGLVDLSVGSSSTSANGITVNEGTVKLAVGGDSYHAIHTNHGLCLRITDGVQVAVLNWLGEACFVEGPYIDGVIPNNIKTIYSLGELSGDATIAGDATVIEMELAGGGGGSGPARIRQGNLLGRSF